MMSGIRHFNWKSENLSDQIMQFQSQDASKTLYSCGNLRVFHNSSITPEQGRFLTAFDPSYAPDTSLASNKTMVAETSTGKGLVQSRILLSKCDIVVPSATVEFFKKEMLDSFIKYMTETVKTFCTYTVANELDFGINIYVDQTCPAAELAWWGVGATNLGWTITRGVTSTALGGGLPGNSARLAMKLRFDSNFAITAPAPATPQFVTTGPSSTIGPCMMQTKGFGDPVFNDSANPQKPWNSTSGMGVSVFGGFESETKGSGAPQGWGQPNPQTQTQAPQTQAEINSWGPRGFGQQQGFGQQAKPQQFSTQGFSTGNPQPQAFSWGK
jgi:hypothetical protein